MLLIQKILRIFAAIIFCMSNFRFILIIFLCATTLNVNAQCCHSRHCQDSMKVSRSVTDMSPSTLIIWYDSSKKSYKKHLLKAVRSYKAEIIYDYKSFNGIAIKIPNGADINDAIKYFQKVKGVLCVNRDRIMHLDRCAADSAANKNGQLIKTEIL